LHAGASLTATPIATPLSYSKADGAAAPAGGGGGWELREIPLAPYAGQYIELEFYATTAADDKTAFYVDGVGTGSLVNITHFSSSVPQLDGNGNPIVVNGVTQCQTNPASEIQYVMSHELIEATTDPTGANLAFVDISGTGGYWDDTQPRWEVAD